MRRVGEADEFRTMAMSILAASSARPSVRIVFVWVEQVVCRSEGGKIEQATARNIRSH